MNKKFSTLVAAILAAGAWTTVSADVVKVSPVVGGTYLIGTEVNEAEGEVSGLFKGTTSNVSGSETFIENMTDAWTLVPVADKNDQFYLMNSSNQALCIASNEVSNGYYSWAPIDAKSIKFKFQKGGLVVAEKVEDSGAFFNAGTPLKLTAGARAVIDYTNATSDPTELAFAVWNDDVDVSFDLADNKTPLQKSFTADEYYLIAADDSHLLTDDGTGTLSADAAITVANVDNYLWKITTGTAADGKTTTYTFTNKKSGKEAIVNNIKSFIVEGSAASFKLFLNSDAASALTADLNVGTAAEFGVYKSPIVNISGSTLNDLLGEGFNMTIKKSSTDKDEIEGLEAFGGKLTAKGDGNGFRLMSGDKYVVLSKKSTWDGANVGSNDRGYKFELVDKVTADHNSWFEFTAYAGNTKSEVVNVAVYSGETGADKFFGNLYIQSLKDLNCLTTSNSLVDDKETWPYITLIADNIVKPEAFLKNAFYTITKLGEKENTILAATSCAESNNYGFVKSVGNELEAQWALTYDAAKAEYTFTNRENLDVKGSLAVNSLREDDNTNDDIYVINGVSYKIATVADAKENDGYMWLGDVKNQRYAMGYYVKALEEGEYLWFVGGKDGNISFEKSTEASVATEMVASEAVDTVKVESVINYYDGTTWKTAKPVLKVPVYTFANVKGDKFGFGDKKYIFGAEAAEQLTIREDQGQYNLRLATATAFENGKIYAGASADYLDQTACVYDDTKNDLFTVVALNRPEYRRLGATVEDGLKDMDLNNVKFYRTNDENTFLYENSANRNANNGEAVLNFLGETNLANQPAGSSLAIFVDTAYVRNNTTKPLYMLSVRNKFVEGTDSVPCPDHGFDPNCPHWTAGTPDYREGAYLVTLEDSTDIAQAKYQGNVRLAFVNAKHVGDLLIVESSNDTLSLANNKGAQLENAATFSFRLVDPASKEGDFYIETAPNAEGKAQYVRIHNSVPVLVSELSEAATFNVSATEDQATANETIAAGNVVVAGANGAVVVKGAEGKSVIVSTILGKVVANEVLTSDNAQITAPQGVVVVSVDGESFKVVVK